MYEEIMMIFAELRNDKVKKIALEQMELVNHMWEIK